MPGHPKRVPLHTRVVRAPLRTTQRGLVAGAQQSAFLVFAFLITRLPPPLHTPQVRALAVAAGLHTSSKRESMGICFIGKRNFSDFLDNYLRQSFLMLRMALGIAAAGPRHNLSTVALLT